MISIIIVSYNTYDITRNCIISIYNYSKGVKFEIILVDNNSSDNSIELLSDEFKDIVYIKNKHNYGFGIANNIGLSQAKGDYILFLNSDTIFLNNVLSIFLNFYNTYTEKDELGALGCIMLDKMYVENHHNSYNNFPSTKTLFTGRFKKNSFKNINHFEVDFIVGADLFIKRDVLQIIGCFDVNYFMYWEEADLQLRLKKINKKRLIINGPKLIHLEGGSNNLRLNKLILFHQSLFYYFKKNSNIFVLFTYLLYLFLYSGKLIFKYNFNFKEIIKFYSFRKNYITWK